MMADWGADVIWMENAHYGDTMRDTMFIKEQARRNQKSISMNPFSEEGREVFFRLIKDADIFIQAGEGPTYERKGLGDDVLWEVNPKLVIVHVSGFGQYGSTDHIGPPTYDHMIQAFGGYMAQNGTVDKPFAAAPIPGDYFTAANTVGAALASVINARATGKGESIDVAMFEIMARMGLYYNINYLNAGITYPRPADRSQPCAASAPSRPPTATSPSSSTAPRKTIGCSTGSAWGIFGEPKTSPKARPRCGSRTRMPTRFRSTSRTGSRQDPRRARRPARAGQHPRQSRLHDRRHGKRRPLPGAQLLHRMGEPRRQDHQGIQARPRCKNNPGQVWRPCPNSATTPKAFLPSSGTPKTRSPVSLTTALVRLG